MATPTSAALIAAAHDRDLTARATALGATLGMTQGEVEAAMPRLAGAPVDDTGENSVATVYEYAAAQPRYRPGEDPAAVTDQHLLHALRTLRG